MAQSTTSSASLALIATLFLLALLPHSADASDYLTFSTVGVKASDALGGDLFGSSVALCDGFLVVGAPYHDPNGILDAGAAYYYSRSQALRTWTLAAKITAPSPVTRDRFGHSVACSASHVAIGAFEYDAGNGIYNQGGVFLYARSALVASPPFLPVNTIVASDGAADDQFGWSVGISSSLLAVGAYFANIGAWNDAGAVYVYFASAWTTQVKISPPNPTNSAYFGYAVSVADVYLGVGAPGATATPCTTCGVVYIYSRSSNTMTLTQTLTGRSSVTGDYFGASLDLTTSHLIVGAPRADEGAVSNCGKAYVHTMSGSSVFVHVTILTASTVVANDNAGSAVAISEGGTYAFIGIPQREANSVTDTGTVEVHCLYQSSWYYCSTFQGTTSTQGRYGSALSVDLTALAIGNPGRTFNEPDVGMVWIQDSDISSSESRSFACFRDAQGPYWRSLL